MSSLSLRMQTARALQIAVSDDSLTVSLSDGRTVSVPLAWYPRLLSASPAERRNWRLIGEGDGVHWPELDEDLSVEGIILGRPSAESQASLKRWLQSRAGMATPYDFETAQRKYRPPVIKLLFIAEAPPQYGSKRFFYFEDVTTRDMLFLEMMKVLYPKKAHFDASADTWEPGFGAQEIRNSKARFLKTFKDDGFYLIDASAEPMPPEATPRIKEDRIRASLQRLKAKLNELHPPAEDQRLQVILISAPVYNVCARELADSGVCVLNQEMIDTPANGGAKKFRRKLRKLLRSRDVKTSDAP